MRHPELSSNADTAHDTAAGAPRFTAAKGIGASSPNNETLSCFATRYQINKPLVNPQLVYIDLDAIEPDRSWMP
jgi:hypothetical protein